MSGARLLGLAPLGLARALISEADFLIRQMGARTGNAWRPSVGPELGCHHSDSKSPITYPAPLVRCKYHRESQPYVDGLVAELVLARYGAGSRLQHCPGRCRVITGSLGLLQPWLTAIVRALSHAGIQLPVLDEPLQILRWGGLDLST
jgi:hypothetical protein